MSGLRPGLVATCLLLAARCAPAGQYDWGSYETSVQHLYGEGATAHAVKDRERLIEEVRKTELKGKSKVPPGKYAQIGYLSSMAGDTAAAKQYFRAEKDAYPESARLMD